MFIREHTILGKLRVIYLTPLTSYITQLHPFHYIVGGVVTAWLNLYHCSESVIVACRCPATVFTHFTVADLENFKKVLVSKLIIN